MTQHFQFTLCAPAWERKFYDSFSDEAFHSELDGCIRFCTWSLVQNLENESRVPQNSLLSKNGDYLEHPLFSAPFSSWLGSGQGNTLQELVLPVAPLLEQWGGIWNICIQCLVQLLSKLMVFCQTYLNFHQYSHIGNPVRPQATHFIVRILSYVYLLRKHRHFSIFWCQDTVRSPAGSRRRNPSLCLQQAAERLFMSTSCTFPMRLPQTKNRNPESAASRQNVPVSR